MYYPQKISTTTDANKEQFGLNVAPLDVPELLENLVRQSEPLLDHLGVKKGVFLPTRILSPVWKCVFSSNLKCLCVGDRFARVKLGSQTNC